MTEPLRFPSRDGVSLEGALDLPPETPSAMLVLCHPHPKMGGTMNAPLLGAFRDEFVARGWGVLRFNFRGIGDSEGSSSTGVDEVADALGAIDAARAKGVAVAITGWSFGAAVALRGVGDERDLVGCAAIAPSIRPRPGITAGVPADLRPVVPVLVVVGSNDDQVSPSDCRRWAEDNGATFEEIKGANHFFWGKYEDLAALVANWLVERL